MTIQTCRSDCPAGDCAGCAFPSAPPVRARCVPSGICHQELDCARRLETLCSPTEQSIDCSVLRHSAGAWCPMFIDARARGLSPDRPSVALPARTAIDVPGLCMAAVPGELLAQSSCARADLLPL